MGLDKQSPGTNNPIQVDPLHVCGGGNSLVCSTQICILEVQQISYFRWEAELSICRCLTSGLLICGIHCNRCLRRPSYWIFLKQRLIDS